MTALRFAFETPPGEEEAGAKLIQACRIAEALLFASAEPLSAESLAQKLPPDIAAEEVLRRLGQDYIGRGVELVAVAGKWSFRTAEDLGFLLARETLEPRKLSRAALETLAIIAYHQPVTRAEIEDIRGVSTSRGTLDVLLETGWIRLRGRRRSPGRPVTFGTTEGFLSHFGLAAIDDLPGIEELKGVGFLEGRLPADFAVPLPDDNPALRPDEDDLPEDIFTVIAQESADAAEEPLEDGEAS